MKPADTVVIAKHTNKLPDKLLCRFYDTMQVHRLTRILWRLTELREGKNSLSTLKMEATYSSIISVSTYQLTWYLNPQDVTWTCIDNLIANFTITQFAKLFYESVIMLTSNSDHCEEESSRKYRKSNILHKDLSISIQIIHCIK